MPMKVKVVTDSTSYAPREARHELDIGVVGLSSTLEGVTYSDDAEDYGPFFRALAGTKQFPTTSQPSVQDLVDAFEGPVSAGRDVVGVFISAEMSGTLATALLARDMLIERHPDATIEVVDGRSNSMELGYAAIAAAREAAAGSAVERVVEAAHAMIERTRFLFVPDTLEYLKRGGRIGGASALIGSLLQVRPILTVVDGTTDVFAKVRTKSRAIDELVAAFVADVDSKGGLREVVVHHIDDEAAGVALAERLSETAGREVHVTPIGPAIGAHVGPGAVGVVYATSEPMEKGRR